MTRHIRKFISLFLALSLLLGCGMTVLADGESPVQTALEKTAGYILSAVPAPNPGSVGGEWAVLGLARSGIAVPQEYWDGYYAAVEGHVKACEGVLHRVKYTEYSRVVIALTAIGANPGDVAGYDLLAPLEDHKAVCNQGINGAVWALIALDSGDYESSAREQYMDKILQSQLPDGGWSLSGRGNADPDVTAMALQALAPYMGLENVAAAVDSALTCLSGMQRGNGGFSINGEASSESVAQVIVALCELGISLDDSRFVKNGKSLFDALMGFALSDGSFRHLSGSGSDLMSTEQALYCLAALARAEKGKCSLYDMDDVSVFVTGIDSGRFGLPGKHEDIKKSEILTPDISFNDISGHKNEAAIMALAQCGIINGMGDGRFAPDESMTRAQFAAIVVRALGLQPRECDAFSDVPSGKWFSAYIGAAYEYGIVNGKGNGIFEPDSLISRQEAAVMVARAAKLCGMDTAMDEERIRNMLAQFPDYKSVAGWSAESMAFCYAEDILDQSEINCEPLRPILRCEIAQMLYNLLDRARLL